MPANVDTDVLAPASIEPRPSPTAAPPKTEAGEYLPGLDGLRALAVLAVLLFHADLTWMRGGFLGVDLFFALSGWLITTLLLREASRSGTIALGAFWGRRIRRLMPAVLVMIGAVLVWGWAFAKPYERDVVLDDAPWAQFYLANWHQIRASVGYWASFDSPSPFDHLWSLAIEEQFYLVWPLTIWLLARLARRRLHGTVLAVTLLGSVASFVTMLALYSGGDPTRVYMGTDTRATSLLVGAALATAPMMRLVAGIVRAVGRRMDVLLIALLAVLGAMWVRTDGTSATWLFSGGLLVHSVLSAVLVAFVATARTAPIARSLGWRPLAAIGRISYGLYLWHWPVYVIADEQRIGLDGSRLVMLRVAISFAVATASYHLVEMPIRSRRWVGTRRAGLGAVGLAMASVTALMVVVPRPEATVTPVDAAGIAEVLENASTTTMPAPTSSTPPSTSAETAPAVAPAEASAATTTTTTTTTVPATTTTVPVVRPVVHRALWWGDSVAYDSGPGVEAALNAAGLEVGLYAYPGKGMLGNDVYDVATRLPKEFAEAGSFDVVIAELSEWDLEASSDEQVLALLSFYGTVIAAQPQATVVFVNGPPSLQRPLDDPDRARLLESAKHVAEKLPGRVWVLDSVAVWGTTFQRDLNGDGVPERKADTIHMCPSGAALYGAWMVSELATIFDGVTPSSDLSWVGGSWTTDPRYNDPPGTCS